LATAEIVLRVRLIGSDHLDATYDEPEISEETQVIEALRVSG
jgi:hypothetical protein